MERTDQCSCYVNNNLFDFLYNLMKLEDDLNSHEEGKNIRVKVHYFLVWSKFGSKVLENSLIFHLKFLMCTKMYMTSLLLRLIYTIILNPSKHTLYSLLEHPLITWYYSVLIFIHGCHFKTGKKLKNLVHTLAYLHRALFLIS